MGIRPSDLYGIGEYRNDPTRFWFDRAVVTFGMMVEADLEKAAEKAKDAKNAQKASSARLMKWLDFDGKLTSQRFAAPPVTKR